MKKSLIIAFLIATAALSANAETFTLPAEFLTNIANGAQFKAQLNVVQRLLVNQVMKNSTINGVKLKDYKAESLLNYFNEDGVFKKIASNKLVEPNTGATLEFNSDDRCQGNSCTIRVDFNGSKGPNQQWTDINAPKDQIIFTLKRKGDGGLDVILPDFN